MGLGIGAIGGKDSMSGSFEDLDVPPTLVSFAVTTQKCDDIVSPEFKAAGHKVVRIAPDYNADGLPDAESQKKVFDTVTNLLRNGKAVIILILDPTSRLATLIANACGGKSVN